MEDTCNHVGLVGRRGEGEKGRGGEGKSSTCVVNGRTEFIYFCDYSMNDFGLQGVRPVNERVYQCPLGQHPLTYKGLCPLFLFV